MVTFLLWISLAFLIQVRSQPCPQFSMDPPTCLNSNPGIPSISTQPGCQQLPCQPKQLAINQAPCSSIPYPRSLSQATQAQAVVINQTPHACNPNNPQIVAVVDNSVANSLADTIQLLIVSNLIEDTINNFNAPNCPSPVLNTKCSIANRLPKCEETIANGASCQVMENRKPVQTMDNACQASQTCYSIDYNCGPSCLPTNSYAVSCDCNKNVEVGCTNKYDCTPFPNAAICGCTTPPNCGFNKACDYVSNCGCNNAYEYSAYYTNKPHDCISNCGCNKACECTPVCSCNDQHDCISNCGYNNNYVTSNCGCNNACECSPVCSCNDQYDCISNCGYNNYVTSNCGCNNACECSPVCGCNNQYNSNCCCKQVYDCSPNGCSENTDCNSNCGCSCKNIDCTCDNACKNIVKCSPDCGCKYSISFSPECGCNNVIDCAPIVRCNTVNNCNCGCDESVEASPCGFNLDLSNIVLRGEICVPQYSPCSPYPQCYPPPMYPQCPCYPPPFYPQPQCYPYRNEVVFPSAIPAQITCSLDYVPKLRSASC